MDNALRGAVLSKFRSISAFAKAMGWDRKKASRIVNRIQYPSAEDMIKMADTLTIKDPDSFCRIFMPSLATMWEG